MIEPATEAAQAAGDRPHGTAHWSHAYLGRPYRRDGPDAYNCADLVADVARERFGVQVALPGAAASMRGRDRQIRAAAAELGRPVQTPAEGDVVLMRAAGRRHEVGHHVGVWCDVDGAPHVLHLPSGAGACLHAVDELPARGFEITEVCRWTLPRTP